MAYFSIFIIGLAYGTTACMFSCMPFLSPILVNNSHNTKQALGVILPFSVGRIVSYIVIAILAYLSSNFVKEILNDNQIFTISLGILTIIMGFVLFYRSVKQNNSCKQNSSLIKNSKLTKASFFLIGAMIAINPCAPIMALLTISANSSSIVNAIGLGVFFGLGAVCFSIVFYAFIVSRVIKGLMFQFSVYKVWVERFAALLLVIVGISVLNRALIL
jgi:cytochrome c biogenesis protein CcdA